MEIIDDTDDSPLTDQAESDDEIPVVETEIPEVENKTKREIKFEKRNRLIEYLEEKRLRDDLKFIDGW